MNLNGKLKEKLQGNDLAQGLFVISASELIAEVVTTLPVDWLAIDLEASPVSKEKLFVMVQAAKSPDVATLVRVESKSHHHIEQVLDLGVGGIIVPKVDTEEQARAVIEAARFPPKGKRGLNPVRASSYFANVQGYLEKADKETILFLQIENQDAVANLESIMQLDHFDGVFVGVGDLALSYNVLDDMEGEVLTEVIRTIANTALTYNKFAGIFAYSTDAALIYHQMGYRLIAIGNDVKALSSGVNQIQSVILAKLSK